MSQARRVMTITCVKQFDSHSHYALTHLGLYSLRNSRDHRSTSDSPFHQAGKARGSVSPPHGLHPPIHHPGAKAFTLCLTSVAESTSSGLISFHITPKCQCWSLHTRAKTCSRANPERPYFMAAPIQNAKAGTTPLTQIDELTCPVCSS